MPSIGVIKRRQETWICYTAIMLLDRFYKKLVPHGDQVENPHVRRRYGTVIGSMGLAVNLLLASGKIIVGSLSGSVAITADGFNNFSDAAASLISLISFRLASKPADHDHPFGHARIEYIAATIVGLLTIFIAWEIGKNAVERILTPEPVRFSWIYLAVLVISIALKLFLYYVNQRTGKRIDSKVMRATAIDSLSDAGATSAVLISLVLGYYLDWQIDGILGLIVSILVIKAGYDILRDTFNVLIGEGPTRELEEKILGHIRKDPHVLGVHDLLVHDYGPGRTFTSAHVEVDAAIDIMDIHNVIDRIERDLADKEGISLVIHVDPIDLNDPALSALRDKVDTLIRSIDPLLLMHDFRVLPGHNRTTLIFSVTVSSDCKLNDDDLKKRIDRDILDIDPRYYTIITFDRTYTDLPPPT